jgi:hypothetical protein
MVTLRAHHGLLTAVLGSLLGLLAGLQSGCGPCKSSDPTPVPQLTGRGEVAGVVEAGAVAPAGEGPWNLGVALFDEEALDPVTLQALDEPELWTTLRVEQLPGPFHVDIGAHFHGWLVVVLDEDGSGMHGTPMAGDLVGIHPDLVETPAAGVTIYLQEIWEH